MSMSIAEINVAILNASRLSGEVVASRLGLEPGIRVVSVACDLAELLMAHSVAVAIIDGDGEDAADRVAAVHQAMPQSRLLVLLAAKEMPRIVDYLAAGASGCLEKDVPFSGLLDALRSVAAGETVCSSSILFWIAQNLRPRSRPLSNFGAAKPLPLTAKELEVARLMAAGLINKEIARKLSIKLRSVRTCVSNILEKLQVKRRHELRGLIRETEGEDRAIAFA